MTFRTELTAQAAPTDAHIGYNDRILCIGSCFAEHLAARLTALRLSVTVNPFGILFNPVSMAQSLDLLAQKYVFTQKDIFEHQNLWHSWRHHGRFSDTTAAKTLQNIQQSADHAAAQLPTVTHLVLTFGTAHVFRERATGRIVANCHKRPTQDFERDRLTVAQIVDSVGTTLAALLAQNRALRVVLSVSPVRYLRDGFIENQRSKATLTLAAAELEQQFAGQLYYFPAYECLNDDLRDYRFYATDLTHPSEMAVDYIVEKFKTTFFDTQTLETAHAVEKVLKRLAHRPLYADSAAFQAHQTQTLAMMEGLENQYPNIDFSVEKK